MQERIRAKARKFIGTMEGGDPYLAEQVEQSIHEDIRKRYGCQRTD